MSSSKKRKLSIINQVIKQKQKQLLPKELIISNASLLTTKGGWNLGDAISHLSTIDGRFINVINKYGLPNHYLINNNNDDDKDVDLSNSNNNINKSSSYVNNNNTNISYFQRLLKTIIYQQLTATSAGPIYVKLLSTLGVKNNEIVTPLHIINADISIIYVDEKKKILVNGIISGLSEAKSKYIKSLAQHFMDSNKLKDVNLNELNDKDLLDKLCNVNGLGKWSVEIFMLFELQRQNVLICGDLGVRRGAAHFFGFNKDYFEGKKGNNELIKKCELWSPYSSLGCSLMWKLSDGIKNKDIIEL
jgi:DNA-3-methyladenine glycosylase II